MCELNSENEEKLTTKGR